MVAPHLVLTGWYKSKEDSFVCLAIQWLRWLARGAAGNSWTQGEYANWRHTTHLCSGYSHKWVVTLQVLGNPLAALRC